MKKTGKVKKNWIGSYRQGRPGRAGPGTKTRSAARAAESEKKWKSEKKVDRLLQTGPGRAGPGTKTRSAAQAAESEKMLEK